MTIILDFDPAIATLRTGRFKERIQAVMVPARNIFERGALIMRHTRRQQLSISHEVAETLPQLRKFAHALTGSNVSGDAYLRATLDAVLAERDLDASEDAPHSIYRLFHIIWIGTRESDHDEGLSPLEIAPGAAFKALEPKTREAILLRSIKGLNDADIAAIMR